MAKSNDAEAKRLGTPSPNGQLDSHYAYPERTRSGYVMGEADLNYGGVSGFRFGLESTGMRHKQSSLGKKVRRG